MAEPATPSVQRRSRGRQTLLALWRSRNPSTLWGVAVATGLAVLMIVGFVGYWTALEGIIGAKTVLPGCFQISVDLGEDDLRELCIEQSRWEEINVGDRWTDFQGS